MSLSKGASVPDQALVPAASSPQAVSTKGFDPSRRPMAALAQLELELRLSEQVFRQYGMLHLDKAEAAREDPHEYNSRMQKAFRNTQRADCCKRALDFFAAQGGIDGYAAQGIETAQPTRREAGSGRKGESPVGNADAPKVKS